MKKKGNFKWIIYKIKKIKNKKETINDNINQKSVTENVIFLNFVLNF
jgi:hypothetical protein